MADDTSPVRIEWTLVHERGTVLARFTCRDTVTQRDYCLEAPVYSLPALRDLIAHTIAEHPELFPDTLIDRRT